MDATRQHVGISSLPGGAEYFRDAIRWYLDEDVDPFDLHDMSVLEVERIRLRMDQVCINAIYIINSVQIYLYANIKYTYVYIILTNWS